MDRTLLKVRKYKAGYELRTEEFSGQEYGLSQGETMKMTSAFTPDGSYIGNSRMARLIVVKRGIKPELRTDHSNTCSIGFCEREQKWYGWSHRAICGFALGDKLFEEFYPGADDHTPFIAHGSKIIETMEDAKQAAMNFAESVS